MKIFFSCFLVYFGFGKRVLLEKGSFQNSPSLEIPENLELLENPQTVEIKENPTIS